MKKKFSLLGLWFLLTVSFVSLADHLRDKNDSGEIVYAPTKNLSAEIYDEKHRWGFKVILCSKYQNRKWRTPTMRIKETYCPLVDTYLLLQNSKKAHIPIHDHEFLIIAKRNKLEPTIVDIDKLPLNAWTGAIEFRIVELVKGNFIIEATKITDDLIDFNLKGRRKYVIEGGLKLGIATPNWYYASVQLAGCVPLGTGWKNSSGCKCVTEFLTYPEGFIDSELGQRIQIKWEDN